MDLFSFEVGDWDMLTEQEKTDLFNEYKKIVYSVAHRYRFLDTVFDDIAGWGFVGFVIAINRYEKLLMESNEKKIEGAEESSATDTLEFRQILYFEVKAEILRNYRGKPSENSMTSLQGGIYEGEGESSITLDMALVEDRRLEFSEGEILSLMGNALNKETKVDREITIAFYMRNKTIGELSKEFNQSQTYISRTAKRGQAVIKKYLKDHDILIENTSEESRRPNSIEARKPKKRIQTYNPIKDVDYGKVKYLISNYPFLSIDEMAKLVNVSPFSLLELLSFPTVKFSGAGSDDSIEIEAKKYVDLLYPERIPSEVITIPINELHKEELSRRKTENLMGIWRQVYRKR